MSSLIVDTATSNETWCVYEHQAVLAPGQPPEVIFVSVCKLIEVYRLREAKANSEWTALFKNGGQVLVRIVGTGLDRAQMQREAMAHMRTFPSIPRCNLRGFNLRGASRPVRCETTGVVYPSQKEAADALNIPQSALSRHLGGHLNHVHNLIFSYAV